MKNGLVGFRHPTHYDKDWPIRPNRRVREGLILSEEANDRLANATGRLPIFRHFDIDESVHSSSDGQKLGFDAQWNRKPG